MTTQARFLLQANFVPRLLRLGLISPRVEPRSREIGLVA